MDRQIYMISRISRDDLALDYTANLNVALQITIDMIEIFKKHTYLETLKTNPTLDDLIKNLKEYNEITVQLKDDNYGNELSITYHNRTLDFTMTLVDQNDYQTIYRVYQINDISKL